MSGNKQGTHPRIRISATPAEVSAPSSSPLLPSAASLLSSLLSSLCLSFCIHRASETQHRLITHLGSIAHRRVWRLPHGSPTASERGNPLGSVARLQDAPPDSPDPVVSPLPPARRRRPFDTSWRPPRQAIETAPPDDAVAGRRCRCLTPTLTTTTSLHAAHHQR